MANNLPITIQAGPLPPQVRYTPQQLFEAMVQRMSLVTQATFALFVTGSTEPSSNVGPWLKNGTSWWVWSNTDGAYVPITIESESLGYIVGPDAPDPAIYSFWIKTDAGGSPLGVFTYHSGAWVDVYASTIAGYLTIAAFNAAIASYLTTATAAATYAPLVSPALTGTPTVPTAAPGTNTTQASSTAFVTAAIAAIPAPPTADQHPAISTATGQTELADDGDYAVAGFGYSAPETGWYLVSGTMQIDNGTAVASGMRIQFYPTVNGVQAAQGSATAVASPPGSQWFPVFTSLVQANSGDTISAKISPSDGVGTGNVTVVNAELSVHFVPG